MKVCIAYEDDALRVVQSIHRLVYVGLRYLALNLVVGLYRVGANTAE